MNILMMLIILFPLLSFIILAISQGKWSENISTVIGISGVGVSAFITFGIASNIYLYSAHDMNFTLIQELWTWFKINDFHLKLSFRLDSLSLILLLVITGIGFIIHIYSAWYMSGNAGYSRFFAYTNLFISNMILLVLSDDLLLMYFGWEGVGLCSYLLIGFYFFDINNGFKALKAFIITRFGDICLLCALFMIYDQYHTLRLNELLKLDLSCLSFNKSTWIAIALLIGAIGKSAQLPLQTWLISAMAGPVPVSALIHSATMVTAGVYLIHRLHNFFLITPDVMYMISIIGAFTLIMASCSALFQRNIKKILAYSTVSQIGYMFLALGVGNWSGALYHITTHAFFKALLFLSAGSLIYACQGEQNIFKMGGLYKSMPFIYICFLTGGASLSGIPIITSGFYSKELILLNLFNNKDYMLLLLGLIGILLTSMYVFRLIFIVFHGKQLITPQFTCGIYQCFPLIILILLSTVVGTKIPLFFLDDINRNIDYMHDQYRRYFILFSELLVLLGIWLAYVFWYKVQLSFKYALKVNDFIKLLIRYLILLFHYGWGIDYLYKIIFIKPYVFIAKKLFYYNDFIVSRIDICIYFLNKLGYILMYIANGKLHRYIFSMNIGAIMILLIIFINFII